MQLSALLSNDPLTTYLNDHLGGSGFGTELARRMWSENRGTEFDPPMRDLAVAIAEDKAELERLVERLGRPRNPLKPAGGWAAEKLGRLKLNGQFRLVGYSPLGRLIELELLNGGVQAKLALWRALRIIAPTEPHLQEPELERLIGRAESQLASIAALHARAAPLALADGHPPV